MKIQPDRMDVQAITAHGPGWVAVDHRQFTESLVLSSDGFLQRWNCDRFEDVNAGHFTALAEHDCELVIFGSGNRLRFVHPQWTAALLERRIGIETMDTAAACRTYNVLAGEGRKVVAALIVEPPA